MTDNNVKIIPSNRAVVGRDLEEIQQQFGLSAADACFLFGISITKWTQLVRSSPDGVIKDPSLALLVRFLAEHPELSVIPKMPTAIEMYALINNIAETEQKRFAILFGAEASAGYRWRTERSRQGAGLQRLMYYMKMAILSRTTGERLELLENWSKTVSREAEARGVSDVFKTGQWRNKEIVKKSLQSIGASGPRLKSKASATKPIKTSLRKNKAPMI